MKKKYLTWGLVFLILFCFRMHYSNKTNIIHEYDVTSIISSEPYSAFLKSLRSNETITIDATYRNNNASYISVDGLNIKDDFIKADKFSEVSGGDYINVQYKICNEKGNMLAVLKVGTTSSLIDTVKDFEIIDSDSDLYKKIGKGKARAKFLKKNNITNDLELLKYVTDTYDETYDMFTKTSIIKNNYRLNYILSSVFLGEKITYVEGALSGFMVSYNEVYSYEKDLYLYNNGKRYYISFVGNDYFTEERIQEIIKNIYFD
jgi:hypothetical protein